MYKKLILPFLFLFDPEKIHNFRIWEPHLLLKETSHPWLLSTLGGESGANPEEGWRDKPW